ADAHGRYRLGRAAKRFRRSGRPAHAQHLQTLSLGMAALRSFRSATIGRLCGYTMDRADLENAALQQRHFADSLGALPRPPESARSAFWRAKEIGRLRQETALVARRRESH